MPSTKLLDSALCDGIHLPTASSAPPLSPVASNLFKVEVGPPTLDFRAFLVASVLLLASVHEDSASVLVGTTGLIPK